MPRSSETVAALAAALAKAQAQLVNPEKSLTATIRGGRPGEGEKSFRYAPLASGLDIVRKTLGQHEIATVQTTALDREAGLINLTTMLAHASGEWIASDWPVCPVSDMASPQRMGAALTYARRYALFTLVGIAGEDDLDAPDLCAPAPGGLESKRVPAGPIESADGQVSPTEPARQGADRRLLPRGDGNGRGRHTAASATSAAILAPEDSAALRARLVGEIAALQSLDSAAAWARDALAAKNQLTSADATLVENAFEQRLNTLTLSGGPDPSVSGRPVQPAGSGDQRVSSHVHPCSDQPGGDATTGDAPVGDTTTGDTLTKDAPVGNWPAGIDKSVLAVPAPRRYRDRDHLRSIIKQPCLICGRKPSDPHHLRYVQPRALGRKASDEFTVPLCRIHHRLVHRVGNEAAWWRDAGIDPIKAAQSLWKRSRLKDERDSTGADARRSNRAPPVGSAVCQSE
jgi:ERF superfamily